MLRASFIFSVFVAAFLAFRPACAAFQTEAEYAFLMDFETGSVLYEKRGDDLMAPASMSKLMTLAVVFKALKEGRVKLTDEFAVSENAWRTGGAPSGTAAMFAPLNTTVTVQDLILGVVVQSGNDACIILAEGLAGSEAAFARLMNDYARKIGLKKSHFVNSTGLPHPKHVMTPREIALLARHIIREYPDYYHYFALKEFKYRRHRFFNRNPLVFMDIGADGLKTGYTEESGYGLVASAVAEGRRMIVVVNGLKTKRERKQEAVRLLNWGLRSFQEFTLFDKGEIVGTARVWGGEKRYVELQGDGPVKILLPRLTQQKRVSAEIAYVGPLIPPVKKGDQVAELRVTTDDGISNSVPLYAAEDVDKGGVITRGLDSLLLLAFGWLL